MIPEIELRDALAELFGVDTVETFERTEALLHRAQQERARAGSGRDGRAHWVTKSVK